MPLLSDAWNNMFGSGFSNYPWLAGTDQKINTGMDPAAQSLAAGGPPLAPDMTQDQLSQLSSLNQPSLWDNLSKGLGSSGSGGVQDALKNASAAMTPQQPKFSYVPPAQMPYRALGPRNIYSARQYSPLDPEAALKALMMG